MVQRGMAPSSVPFCKLGFSESITGLAVPSKVVLNNWTPAPYNIF